MPFKNNIFKPRGIQEDWRKMIEESEGSPRFDMTQPVDFNTPDVWGGKPVTKMKEFGGRGAFKTSINPFPAIVEKVEEVTGIDVGADIITNIGEMLRGKAPPVYGDIISGTGDVMEEVMETAETEWAEAVASEPGDPGYKPPTTDVAEAKLMEELLRGDIGRPKAYEGFLPLESMEALRSLYAEAPDVSYLDPVAERMRTASEESIRRGQEAITSEAIGLGMAPSSAAATQARLLQERGAEQLAGGIGALYAPAYEEAESRKFMSLIQALGIEQEAGTADYQDWLRTQGISGQQQLLQSLITGTPMVPEYQDYSPSTYERGMGYATDAATLYWLATMISDVRVKENINKVGETAGINIYEFNYIGIPDKRYRGVIAQEITHIPGAVITGDDGLLRVNYNKIPVDMEEV